MCVIGKFKSRYAAPACTYGFLNVGVVQWSKNEFNLFHRNSLMDYTKRAGIAELWKGGLDKISINWANLTTNRTANGPNGETRNTPDN